MGKFIFGIPRSKFILYGLGILFIGLLLNYHFRSIVHNIKISSIILGSDSEGYYQYLPYFFLKDWSEFVHLPWALPYGEGRTISAFTCGMAIMWSPFFLMAHFISHFFQLETDGHANVYYGFVIISAIFYVSVGLLFLYKFLLNYFDRKISLRAILLFFFATNLFYYTLFSPGMSHAYSFALISIFLYYTHKYYKDHTIRSLLFMALPMSMAVLIRPTNILALFFVLLFDVYSWKALLDRIIYWIKKTHHILIFFIVALIVFIPQMLYWHTVTGKFLVYSYQDFGFPYLKAPQFSTVLLGKRNGWLIYTPIVNFALLSLMVLIWKRKLHSFSLLLILFASVYINGSWWVPTFSAALGQRAMIDFLPFLVLPMAWLLHALKGQNRILNIAFWVLIFGFIVFNIQFSYKYSAWFWWDTEWSWDKIPWIFKI